MDPQLVINMPKSLTAFGGIDALVHALESYVSIMATDYTRVSWGLLGRVRAVRL